MQKIIFITGASSGFGRDTAVTLSAAGHRVFAGMRDVNGRNKEVAEALRSKGIMPVALDVTCEATTQAAIQTVLEKSGGRLDVVINNAGIAATGVSESFTPEQLRELFEVNVFGIQRVLRAVLPTMRKQGDGLIINTGSILGRVTFPFWGLYGASKFAVEAMTDSYRYELSQLGVDVVLVQPSAYPTNMYAAMQQPVDAARAISYGEIGAIPSKMFETFAGMFAAENAPNPHDVALAIAKLVATTKGQRTDRLVVGQAFGADAINAAVAPLQRQVLAGLGLDMLASIKQ